MAGKYDDDRAADDLQSDLFSRNTYVVTALGSVLFCAAFAMVLFG